MPSYARRALIFSVSRVASAADALEVVIGAEPLPKHTALPLVFQLAISLAAAPESAKTGRMDGHLTGMKISDPARTLQMMRRAIRDLAESGVMSIHTETGPVAFYGFSPGDVTAVHLSKSGVTGIWFRLEDGRVLNRYGGIDDPDPALYDPGGT